MEASFLACQFLPVVPPPSLPPFFPHSPSRCNPNFALSFRGCAVSLSFSQRLFSLLPSRRGDFRQKEGKVRESGIGFK